MAVADEEIEFEYLRDKNKVVKRTHSFRRRYTKFTTTLSGNRFSHGS